MKLKCITHKRHLTVTNCVDKSRHMKSELAIEAFSALAQSTRLDVFRMLVKEEPAGLLAGEIARRLDVPHNTMSTHLAILSLSPDESGAERARDFISNHYATDSRGSYEAYPIGLEACRNSATKALRLRWMLQDQCALQIVRAMKPA